MMERDTLMFYVVFRTVVVRRGTYQYFLVNICLTIFDGYSALV